MNQLDVARGQAIAGYRKLRSTGGDTSLYHIFLNSCAGLLEAHGRVTSARKDFAAVLQAREEEVRIVEEVLPGLQVHSELRNNFLNDLLRRVRLVEGTFLEVSPASSPLHSF